MAASYANDKSKQQFNTESHEKYITTQTYKKYKNTTINALENEKEYIFAIKEIHQTLVSECYNCSSKPNRFLAVLCTFGNSSNMNVMNEYEGWSILYKSHKDWLIREIRNNVISSKDVKYTIYQQQISGTATQIYGSNCCCSQPITNLFYIRHKENGDVIRLGCECITKNKTENPQLSKIASTINRSVPKWKHDHFERELIIENCKGDGDCLRQRGDGGYISLGHCELVNCPKCDIELPQYVLNCNGGYCTNCGKQKYIEKNCPGDGTCLIKTCRGYCASDHCKPVNCHECNVEIPQKIADANYNCCQTCGRKIHIQKEKEKEQKEKEKNCLGDGKCLVYIDDEYRETDHCKPVNCTICDEKIPQWIATENIGPCSSCKKTESGRLEREEKCIGDGMCLVQLGVDSYHYSEHCQPINCQKCDCKIPLWISKCFGGYCKPCKDTEDEKDKEIFEHVKDKISNNGIPNDIKLLIAGHQQYLNASLSTPQNDRRFNPYIRPNRYRTYGQYF